MDEYEFDPDDVYRSGTKIRDQAIHLNQYVTSQLRRHVTALPEMPAPVRGEVVAVLQQAIAHVAEAVKAINGVGRELRKKSEDMTDLDEPADLGWGWKAGDIAISVTGLDAGYKTWGGLDLASGQWTGGDYTAEEKALAWGSFGLNFVGGPAIKGVWKGGKWVVGAARGAKTANQARVAAQLARVSRGMKPPPPVGDPRVAAQLQRVANAGNTAARATPTMSFSAAESAKGGYLMLRGRQYEILSTGRMNGVSRASHRREANKRLAEELKNNDKYRAALDEKLGTDVLKHMQSGKGQLKNPPGTNWHHSVEDPDFLQLLTHEVHTKPSLQPILHPGPNGSGGYLLNAP